MNLNVKLKIYLKDLKSPIQCILDNANLIDKLDMLLCDQNQYVNFGNIMFAKDKFICYTFE